MNTFDRKLFNIEISATRVAQQTKAEANPFLVRIIDPEKSYLGTEWILVYATLLLVAVTCALAIYTAKLFRATVLLAEDARLSSERQNNIERPWIFISQARVVRREGVPINPNLPNNWYISFVFKNIGRTPALIKTCVTTIAIKGELLEFPNYEGCNELVTQSSLSASESFETDQFGPSPEKTIINGETANLVVYGKITYTQLNGTEHETGFAVDVSPNFPAFSTFAKKNYEFFT